MSSYIYFFIFFTTLSFLSFYIIFIMYKKISLINKINPSFQSINDIKTIYNKLLDELETFSKQITETKRILNDNGLLSNIEKRILSVNDKILSVNYVLNLQGYKDINSFKYKLFIFKHKKNSYKIYMKNKELNSLIINM